MLAAALLAMASGCCAEKVLSIGFIISRNDSVELQSRILEDAYATKYINPGAYRIEITDGSTEVYSTSLNVPFLLMSDPPETLESVSVELRIPYQENMRRLTIYKNSTRIFETGIDLCNANAVCDIGYETHMSCPSDCPTDKKDGVCIKDTDAVCDPDCGPGVDADCADKGSGSELLYAGIILMAALIAAFILYKKKKKG